MKEKAIIKGNIENRIKWLPISREQQGEKQTSQTLQVFKTTRIIWIKNPVKIELRRSLS